VDSNRDADRWGALADGTRRAIVACLADGPRPLGQLAADLPVGRLGSRADQVHWLTADVLSWHPRRRYQAWHDRAAFHFLTTEEHRQLYLHTLDTATAPGAIAVFGCFAPDGPQYCSGLPVARYSAAQLARQVGAEWLLISQDREEHITPAGTIQPLTWVALRRQS
jgi:hypothetical protein